MVLQTIAQQDDYEGDFATRRALIYTLSFTAKTFFFNHIAQTPEGLIKKYSWITTQIRIQELRKENKDILFFQKQNKTVTKIML